MMAVVKKMAGVKVGEGGIATISKQKTRFRVMKRLDQNHIKIFIL